MMHAFKAPQKGTDTFDRFGSTGCDFKNKPGQGTG